MNVHTNLDLTFFLQKITILIQKQTVCLYFIKANQTKFILNLLKHAKELGNVKFPS